MEKILTLRTVHGELEPEKFNGSATAVFVGEGARLELTFDKAEEAAAIIPYLGKDGKSLTVEI